MSEITMVKPQNTHTYTCIPVYEVQLILTLYRATNTQVMLTAVNYVLVTRDTMQAMCQYLACHHQQSVIF